MAKCRDLHQWKLGTEMDHYSTVTVVTPWSTVLPKKLLELEGGQEITHFLQNRKFD
jgi:hypothetical protein